MKKYIYLTFIVLVFAACVASKTPEQVKFEEQKLLHDLSVLKECRIKSAKKLDDKVSPADVIAVAVIKECSKEAKYVMNNNMQDRDKEYRDSFEKQMNGVQTSGVIGIILKHRKNIQEPKPTNPDKLQKYKDLISK
jgi:hypothetical protein